MKKLLNYFASLISLVTILALCIYAIHDVQSAEGVGFYYCLKFNASNRLIFDIVTDIIFFILLMVFLLLPVLTLKKRSLHDFSCFTLLFVSFIPSISTAYVFGLFRSLDAFTASVNVNIMAMEFSNHFRILIPFIVLLAGINYVIKNKKPEKAEWIMMIGAFLIILITIPFSGLYSLATYIASYLFIIVIFRLMKELSGKLWLIHIILFFTAIYRIITVCQAYTL